MENEVKLLKHTEIKNNAIKLEKDKQPSFDPIYSLEPMEPETLKTYIETNLANDFIRFSKSSAKVFIFFNSKLD